MYVCVINELMMGVCMIVCMNVCRYECDEYKLYINLFWINQLSINILKHNYVPKHEKIPNDEFIKLKELFNLNTRFQFPKHHIICFIFIKFIMSTLTNNAKSEFAIMTLTQILCIYR